MTTLARIRQEVRNITGMASEDQLPTTDLDTYINEYYLYEFPYEQKSVKLDKFTVFNLEPNVEAYAVSTFAPSALNFSSPAYVAGYESVLYQDPTQFYRNWPITKYIEQVGTGDGGPSYNLTLTNTPCLRGTLIVTFNNTFGNAFTAVDDSSGGFTGDVTAGAINYETGAITGLTFSAAVPIGAAINAEYLPYVASRPSSVLLYNNVFYFRPVPDIAYEFKIASTVLPTQLLAAGDQPEFVEWWKVIAYGTALQIFMQQTNFESYNMLYGVYKKTLLTIQRRTLKQYSQRRVATMYSPEGDAPFGQQGVGNIYPLT